METAASIALALGGVAALMASEWVHALERGAEQRAAEADGNGAEEAAPAQA